MRHKRIKSARKRRAPRKCVALLFQLLEDLDKDGNNDDGNEDAYEDIKPTDNKADVVRGILNEVNPTTPSITGVDGVSLSVLGCRINAAASDPHDGLASLWNRVRDLCRCRDPFEGEGGEIRGS